jgi:hypothetical protein
MARSSASVAARHKRRSVWGKSCIYDWGSEPGTGLPHEFWDYHAPIYRECRRVLKPHGVLAWAMGFQFHEHFHEWFGGHRIWGSLMQSRCAVSS